MGCTSSTEGASNPVSIKPGASNSAANSTEYPQLVAIPKNLTLKFFDDLGNECEVSI